MTTITHEFDQHDFRKSSYSGENGNNCVEVALTPTVVGVRDSKHDFGSADDVVLRFTPKAFVRFLDTAKGDVFTV